MNTMLMDIRYALRQLRRAPGFAIAAVLTLALGIGASSAIFCIMDGLWLHPMPVSQQGQLARVFATTAQESDGFFNYLDYQAIGEARNGLQGACGNRTPRHANAACRRNFSHVADQCGLNKLLRASRREANVGSRVHRQRCREAAHASGPVAELSLVAA